jgi:hypothetical protein
MRLLVACALAGAFGVTAAAQSPAEMERHIAAARAAAGTHHVAIVDRICNEARALSAPAAGGGRGGRAGGGRGARQGGPPPPPARDTWHAEPAKVFDNIHHGLLCLPHHQGQRHQDLVWSVITLGRT